MKSYFDDLLTTLKETKKYLKKFGWLTKSEENTQELIQAVGWQMMESSKKWWFADMKFVISNEINYYLATKLNMIMSLYENGKVPEEYTIWREKTRRELCDEGARDMLQQLIVYAEAEERSVAREIRIAVDYLKMNNNSATTLLGKEWKERLHALGRNKTQDENGLENKPENRRENGLVFNDSVNSVVAHADSITYFMGEYV